MELSNKKILLISPRFNNYGEIIKTSFEKHGAKVHLYSENMNYIFSKLRYLSRSLNDFIQDKLLKKIINDIDEHYDLLIVIKGEFLDSHFFDSLSRKSSFGKKVLYQWDSVTNNPNCLNISSYFDVVATFDRNDSLQFGFTYFPLFFSNYFNADSTGTKKYDLFFIGAFHSERHLELLRVKSFADKNNLTFCCKLYINFFTFIYRKLFDSSFSNVRLSDVIFKTISLKGVAKLISESDYIVDIAHKHQSGLTIRTFEALGSGKKLITNNKSIKHEVFYNNEKIFLLSDILEGNKFDNKPETHTNTDCNILPYSVDLWVIRLILLK